MKHKIKIGNFEVELEQLPNGKFKKPDLVNKYKGFRYSISPLKQTNETIMIFQKPYKTGSCLHDTLAYENGDKECCCGALDIDGNRCETSEKLTRDLSLNGAIPQNAVRNTSKLGSGSIDDVADRLGRYPAQTICSEATAKILDEQSGVSKPKKSRTGIKGGNSGSLGSFAGSSKDAVGYWPEDAGGGCSKILHKADFEKEELDEIQEDTTCMEEKLELLENGIPTCNHNPDNIRNDIAYCARCNFENEEHDLYIYHPKVSKSERNAGCEEMEDRVSHLNSGGIVRECSVEKRLQENGENAPTTKNSHPTLKPISLNEKVLRLFKTPNPQTIIYPFAGSGSEVIGGYKAGFTEWSGCELNPEYCEIAKARIKHWAGEDIEVIKDITPQEAKEMFIKEDMPNAAKVMETIEKKLKQVKPVSNKKEICPNCGLYMYDGKCKYCNNF